jgi:putative ABC transport system substrate-binding protein
MKPAPAAVTFALILGVLFGPLGAEAQQAGRVYRVGYLGTSNPTHNPSLDAFRQGMRELGWVEGQNVAIEYRWAEGKMDRLPALASDLVKRPIDVIVASGLPGVRAARQATCTVPIVGITSDPVAAGFAESLARLGGTVTGLATQFEDVVTRQLQVLKEAVPRAARIAILIQHSSLNSTVQKAVETAARTLGLTGRVFEIPDPPAFDDAFRTAKVGHADAVQVLPSPAFMHQRTLLAELAVKHRLPAIYETREYVDAGGLMSYGPRFPALYAMAVAPGLELGCAAAQPDRYLIVRPCLASLSAHGESAPGQSWWA